MENSKIEWTTHTFNSWQGCVRLSPACENCYAEALDHRWGRKNWGPTAPRLFMGDAYWQNPVKWNRDAQKAGKRARVFCASLSDVFEQLRAGHPDTERMNLTRIRLWKLIEATPWLVWLLLTKRPENMIEFTPESWRNGWQVNAIPMTTVESQKYADERIPELLKVPAVAHGLSMEPLLGEVRLDQWQWRHYKDSEGIKESIPTGAIDWVIVGGESGPGARPSHPDWFQSLREQCESSETAFFFKQWGCFSPEPSAAYSSYIHMGRDGKQQPTADPANGVVTLYKRDKKESGRILDCRTWDQIPEVLL